MGSVARWLEPVPASRRLGGQTSFVPCPPHTVPANVDTRESRAYPGGMIGSIHEVVLDCPDPAALAEFYRGVLGGQVSADEDGRWVDLLLDGGPRLGFQHSPGFVAPVWPGEDGDQQFHLDIAVDDLSAAHEQLLALGARHLETHRGFRVYLDPAGHPFCTVNE